MNEFVTTTVIQFGIITLFKMSQLVSIRIWNDGTGTSARGNYRFTIRGRRNQLLKEGEVLNWARNSKTPLALLQKVTNTAYPKGVK